MPIQLDSYERMAVQAAARSGARQFANTRDALAGERPFSAQVRILFELARRGHVDLNALARGKVKP